MTGGRDTFLFIRALLLGISICLACAAGVYFFLFSTSPQHEAEYRRLMLMSNPTLAGNQAMPYTARQARYGVQKNLTFLREGQPLEICLLSREAQLVFDRQSDSAQIIEEMQGVQAYMQEELFYLLPDGKEAVARHGELFLRDGKGDTALPWPLAGESVPMQVVCHLEADAGLYFYKNDTCHAENVSISRYIAAGHQLPGSLVGAQKVFSGIADSVEFTLREKDPHFTARNVKATAFPGLNIKA